MTRSKWFNAREDVMNEAVHLALGNPKLEKQNEINREKIVTDLHETYTGMHRLNKQDKINLERINGNECLKRKRASLKKK